MSTQKAKFELFARLQSLGFSYDEAASLRRIEMTLQRWAERECGDGSDWAIERDEKTGKPYNVYHGPGSRADAVRSHRIADREAGALRRLKAIVDRRNNREVNGCSTEPRYVFAYHQGDCRGCMLYLIHREKLTEDGALLPIDQFYTRGIAVYACTA